jgi:hypothetical protein
MSSSTLTNHNGLIPFELFFKVREANGYYVLLIYNIFTQSQNDLAVVRLSKDVIYKEHIIPVCLPDFEEKFEGDKAIVIG